MMTKLLAWWLLIAGVVWAFVAAFVDATMAGIAERIYALPIHLLLYFAGPIALLAGAILILAGRRRTIGACLTFGACLWLTYLIAPDFVSSFRRQPLQGPPPYALLVALLLLVLLTDAAALILLRRLTQISNQSPEPTAGRCNDQI
jgi:hypothetical protein